MGEFEILTPSTVIGGGDSDQLLVLPQLLPLSLGPAKLHLLHWVSSGSLLQRLFVLVRPLVLGSSVVSYVSRIRTGAKLSKTVYPSISTSALALVPPKLSSLE
jgi:hypothetical protein